MHAAVDNKCPEERESPDVGCVVEVGGGLGEGAKGPVEGREGRGGVVGGEGVCEAGPKGVVLGVCCGD